MSQEKKILVIMLFNQSLAVTLNRKLIGKRLKKIGLLGIDEISLKKGYQDFVTIITSWADERTQVLAVIKGREKAKIKGFLSIIPKRLKKTIVGVCCDMCEAYSNAALEVFGKEIPIIVDRFHVARLYRKSLIALQKNELARLRKELSEEKYKSLRPAITILCHNKEYVTPEEKKILNNSFKYSPALKFAYKLCCKLTGIYNSKIGTKSANKKIEIWIQQVKESSLKCFNHFIKALKKWKSQIINYFRRRETSGFVEGFNNKVKVLKRRCYGIFDIKHLFQRLFLDVAGYDLFFEETRSWRDVTCNTKSKRTDFSSGFLVTPSKKEIILSCSRMFIVICYPKQAVFEPCQIFLQRNFACSRKSILHHRLC